MRGEMRTERMRKTRRGSGVVTSKEAEAEEICRVPVWTEEPNTRRGQCHCQSSGI